MVPFYFYSSNWFLVAARLLEGDRPNLIVDTSSKILTLLIETVTWGILNPGFLTLSGPAFSVVRQARGGHIGPDAKNQG